MTGNYCPLAACSRRLSPPSAVILASPVSNRITGPSSFPQPVDPACSPTARLRLSFSCPGVCSLSSPRGPLTVRCFAIAVSDFYADTPVLSPAGATHLRIPSKRRRTSAASSFPPVTNRRAGNPPQPPSRCPIRDTLTTARPRPPRTSQTPPAAAASLITTAGCPSTPTPTPTPTRQKRRNQTQTSSRSDLASSPRRHSTQPPRLPPPRGPRRSRRSLHHHSLPPPLPRPTPQTSASPVSSARSSLFPRQHPQ